MQWMKAGIWVACGLVIALGAEPARAEVDLGRWWQDAPAVDGGIVGIQRSPADDRHYRYLRLANGLQVVLISDPAGDKSAAALSVATGSFDNPGDWPGLAHFLEHMLFLGTEKYPAAGAYQQFISDHGGSHNAYTSLERTTYFFDIDAPHLDAALDRFAQFFIAPRFDPRYVARERNAVEAEYRLKLRDDERRQGDVVAEVINPAHPLARFSVGNAQTLADRQDRPVRDELMAFYQRRYSADRMALAVSGRDSLDALEQMVTARFGAIPKRQAVPKPAVVPLLAEGGPVLVRMAPDRERRELGLLFELPPQAPLWQTKPAFFVAHLLGDEGEHSLLAELKRRNWAESLNAGPAYDSDRGAAFAISIGLTPAGLVEREAVLDLIWQWIATVREEGLEAWRYRELAAMQAADFRFLQKTGASEQVVGVAEALHDYPPGEVLRGPYALEQFRSEEIAAVLDQLRPERALITVMAPEVGELPRRSRYYQVPYGVDRIPAARLASWGKAADLAAVDLKAVKLRLPDPNPYIPQQFPVSERGGPMGTPQHLPRRDGMELWFYPDRHFGTPRAVFSAQIFTPHAGGRRGAALTALYLGMVSDELGTEVYPALLAGLDFDLQRWEGGIAIGMRGYADKQELLLRRVLRVLAAPRRDDDRFARVKAGLIRDWRNTGKDWPVRRAMSELGPVLRELPRPLELAAELETATQQELREFSATLYRGGAVKVYAGGAVDAGRARRLAAMTAKRLGIAGGSSEYFYRMARLPMATESPRVALTVPEEQKDAAALWYLQGGEDSLAERARVALLAQLIEAPFYNSLRTERQLGYVVGSQIMPFHRVPGMILYVQSPRVDGDRLAAEIEQFVDGRCPSREAGDRADLERARQAVLAHLEEQPKNIDEQADRHRESLALNYREFDFRPQLAAAVRAIDAEDLAVACERILGAKRRGLMVLASSAPAGEAEQPAGLKPKGEFRYRW